MHPIRRQRPGDGVDPEHEALLADSVGLALLVVLETLAPAERLAFVLHDMFDLSFDEIAPIVGRSPTAARQLASRARRRVQGGAAAPTPIAPASAKWSTPFSPPRAAATSRRCSRCSTRTSCCAPTALPCAWADRRDPRCGGGGQTFAGRAQLARPALVDGAVGVVVGPRGRPLLVFDFTITDGKIVAIDVVADPERLHQLDLAVLWSRSKEDLLNSAAREAARC